MLEETDDMLQRLQIQVEEVQTERIGSIMHNTVHCDYSGGHDGNLSQSWHS